MITIDLTIIQLSIHLSVAASLFALGTGRPAGRDTIHNPVSLPAAIYFYTILAMQRSNEPIPSIHAHHPTSRSRITGRATRGVRQGRAGLGREVTTTVREE